MTNQETNVTNAFETTLSSSLASGATTLNVDSTTGSPAVPFYATIDPGDDAKREVVLVDSSKTATTLVLSAASKRGQDGTSDVAHDSGAVVAMVPVAALWTDIGDRLEGHDHSGGTSGTAVATGDLTGHTEAAHTALNLLNETSHDALDHSGLTGIPVVVSAVKSADETVNNSTTLQNDDHLSVALAASTTYIIEGSLDIDATAMTNGFKGALTVPSGATLSWGREGVAPATTSGGAVTFATSNGVRQVESFFGHVVVSSTSGNLQFQWAQTTAEGNDLVLKSGSWLRIEKVA